MGIELELALLFVAQTIGTGIFAAFEVETPAWRKITKWLVMAAITLGLYRVVGHWSLVFPLFFLLVGISFHLFWCRKHGIDPLRATPRRKYYELRGWPWHD